MKLIRNAVIRETMGIMLYAGGVVSAAVILCLTIGLLPGSLIIASLASTVLGRYLASTFATETGGESERDSVPQGPGPLYVDPDDPQALIPRR